MSEHFEPENINTNEFNVKNHENLNNENFANEMESKLQNTQTNATIFAEADSSTINSVPDKNQTTLSKEDQKSEKDQKEKKLNGAINLSQYYLSPCEYLNKIEIPKQYRDLLLWTNPKLTGAVFGTAFVLLLILSIYSFLTVVSSLLMLTICAIGSYRFYLAIIFRIKGVQDQTFDKLNELEFSLPKDKVKQLADLLEKDINKSLKQLKSILLWDNIINSSLSIVALYVIYSIGCVFNALTLLNLILVSLFTLPKVYQVYKQPIDQAIEKATASIHMVVDQAMTKVPFLNKKKVQ